MNINKIREVKLVYAQRNKKIKKNNNYKKEAFFSNIMKKLDYKAK